MRIAVLGAGSIGCLIAAKLVEAGHEVLVHARGEWCYTSDFWLESVRCLGL